ncbi:MAG: insulinase family protein [Gemmatimonadaceae bacterium]|nr:insulinase family protein [Gemmatimonadaceae bacterium]
MSDQTPAGVHRTDAPNGLTVLSEYMPGRRTVAFGAWVRYGTLHERREQMGLAHLLEHMVFKGTASRTARDLAFSLESLGGSLDAYTEREFTSYQARVLDRHLETAVDVVGDLVFHPKLAEADLALERQVILEEIGMVEDTPDDLIFDLHNEALWGDHPHAWRILGTRETVSSLDADALRALWRAQYQPARLVVAAAGNVTHEQLLEVLARAGWLDAAAGSAEAPSVPVATPSISARVHHARKDISQVHVVLGGAATSVTDSRRHAFGLLGTLVGGGMSSRLFQRVREELGYAYSVYHFHSPFADTGSHGIYLASAPETAQLALDAAREILRDVATNGLPEAELEAGKQQLAGQLVMSLESVSARMYRAATSALYHEPVRTIDELLEEVAAVNVAQVADVARTFFDPDRATLVSLGPRAVR